MGCLLEFSCMKLKMQRFHVIMFSSFSVIDKIKGKKKNKYKVDENDFLHPFSSQSKPWQFLKIFAGPEGGFSWFLARPVPPYLSWDRSLWLWRVALSLRPQGKLGSRYRPEPVSSHRRQKWNLVSLLLVPCPPVTWKLAFFRVWCKLLSKIKLENFR